jgi:hypothetical protein
MACTFLLFSLGCVESPRFSVRKGRKEQATHDLAQLWKMNPDDSLVLGELQILEDEQVAALTVRKSHWTRLEPWRQLFGQSANVSRLLFLISAQLLSQWSGTNAITSNSMQPGHWAERRSSHK